jgi:hypothetical protein
MRQFRMRPESLFIPPPRMNVKEPPVSHGSKQVKAQASLLFARRPRHIAQCLLNRILFSLTRMQPHKHILLHRFLPQRQFLRSLAILLVRESEIDRQFARRSNPMHLGTRYLALRLALRLIVTRCRSP